MSLLEASFGGAFRFRAGDIRRVGRTLYNGKEVWSTQADSATGSVGAPSVARTPSATSLAQSWSLIYPYVRELPSSSAICRSQPCTSRSFVLSKLRPRTPIWPSMWPLSISIAAASAAMSANWWTVIMRSLPNSGGGAVQTRRRRWGELKPLDVHAAAQ